MGWYDFAVCFLSLVVVLCHWGGMFLVSLRILWLSAVSWSSFRNFICLFWSSASVWIIFCRSRFAFFWPSFSFLWLFWLLSGLFCHLVFLPSLDFPVSVQISCSLLLGSCGLLRTPADSWPSFKITSPQIWASFWFLWPSDALQVFFGFRGFSDFHGIYFAPIWIFLTCADCPPLRFFFIFLVFYIHRKCYA